MSITRDWLVDAGERAARSFAFAVLSVQGVSEGFDAFHADWYNALGVGVGAAILSLLVSVVALGVGSKGTASLTRATVPASYADALTRGIGDAGLRPGPGEVP